MTERKYAGQENRLWTGVTTSVMDPDQEGRLQIRIHGIHDDSTNIPDSALPWSKPLQPVTSAAHNKMGHSAVGAIVGSTVFGFFLDSDRQLPIHIGTIAKAGDASDFETSGGSETLKQGTNSTPPGSRIANNSFTTRVGRNIQQDDQTPVTYQNNYTPPEQNDSDGQNITAQAIANTKYANNPSVASLTTLAGSILKQLQQVDPQNINAVLPQAIPAFLKMKDLNSFSSAQGTLGVMGQALGMALQQIGSAIGQGNMINSLANTISQGEMSSNLSTALQQALLNLNVPIVTSDLVNSVINQSLQQIINLLQTQLQNGSLSLAQFEAIIAIIMEQLQDNGSQATIGSTFSNIFNMLQQLLPTIAGPIQTSLNIHFPESVFNIQTMTTALQKFSMNQAILKAPSDGRKALAIQATSQVVPPGSNTSLSDVISGIQGVTSSAANTISSAYTSFIGGS